ncbi:FAD-dependent oxidoreductase [Clostridium rectalis]|uniref:FAD-dependent oxidoreductase n=1 Tax=Clostridium rectalis TaxID=2040295 RepID=UPI000F639D7B|nr:FAD-dependent oxidoreductase [Clostridium rectalis]
MKVIVVGGGWAGCASAVSARKLGAQVTILERTDMILGTGLVGGIMRNNGRYTAELELSYLGGGELFNICKQCCKHDNINFPGHAHARLYNVGKIHGAVKNFLENMGIKIEFMSRAVKVHMENNRIIGVEDDKKFIYEGDVFIDCTGTAGPMENCSKYGNGCAMCIIRCPSFGGRKSIASLAGVKEYIAKRKNGQVGAMSGSCKLLKESLSTEIQEKLNKDGVCIVPIPQELVDDHLGVKACQQYALKEFKNNLIILDTGHAKLMAPYYNIEKLRKIPGFKNVKYEDPYAGSKGNSIRFIGMCPRDNYLKVLDVENLFCAGEKAGPLVGHTEAIVTGTLAGYNSVKYICGCSMLSFPRKLSIGDGIAFVNEEVKSEEGLSKKFTFSGSVYFERMKKLGLYSVDKNEIKDRVEGLSLLNILNSK